MSGEPGERSRKQQNERGSKERGGWNLISEGDMVGRHTGRNERNRVNICKLVFSNPMLLINFISLILRL